MIPHILGTLALLGVALLMGATLYESVVMAPNFERDVPASIAVARQFLVRTTPAHYFRILTPVTQLLLVAGVLASWPVTGVRWGLGTALGILVLLDVITFSFHYPRLAVMFRAPLPDDPAPLRRAAREWTLGNHVRLVLLVLAFLAALHAFAQLPMHGAA